MAASGVAGGSWVPGADESEFPIEALPYGTLRWPDGRADSLVVRIGDHALDLPAAASAGLFSDELVPVVDTPTLQPLLHAGRRAWRAVRARVEELLADAGARSDVEPHLHPVRSGSPQLAFAVADYVDFYSSREHAENVGRIFRPGGEALPENWRWLPAGYHGRSGTVVCTDTDVVRPFGQRRSATGVSVGPTDQLDYELELGFVLGGQSSIGHTIREADVEDHIFGVVLVNDWSARDIQRWEYQPLGPFLGKSFLTSVSAWVLPFDALGHHRVGGPRQDPPPFEHLRTTRPWGLDLELSVAIRPNGERSFTPVSQVNTQGLYWSCAQQLMHLTSNGASVRPGDLLATGTISGMGAGSFGSLLEASKGGAEPFRVGAIERTFLEDGDEVRLSGYANVRGRRMALGDVSGRVVAGPATLG